MRDPDRPTLLARYRPTLRQATGRGIWRGTVVGAAVAVVALGAVWSGALHVPTAAWLAGTVGPVVAGAVDGAMRGRDAGVDVDDHGLHLRPPSPAPVVTWRQVAGVHAERRHRCTVVTVTGTDGSVVRLPAPYDGPLLGGDPDFERKLFTLRHLWETRRHWEA